MNKLLLMPLMLLMSSSVFASYCGDSSFPQNWVCCPMNIQCGSNGGNSCTLSQQDAAMFDFSNGGDEIPTETYRIVSTSIDSNNRVYCSYLDSAQRAGLTIQTKSSSNVPQGPSWHPDQGTQMKLTCDGMCPFINQ